MGRSCHTVVRLLAEDFDVVGDGHAHLVILAFGKKSLLSSLAISGRPMRKKGDGGP